MDKKVAEIVVAVVVVGVLGLAAGYMIAGGPQKLTGQFAIGENVIVNVKLPGESAFKSVNISSGMTVLDAVSNVMPLKTEVFSFGTAVKTVDNKWLVYTVNGESPPVGMAAYQLKGGEKIDLTLG